MFACVFLENIILCLPYFRLLFIFWVHELIDSHLTKYNVYQQVQIVESRYWYNILETQFFLLWLHQTHFIWKSQEKNSTYKQLEKILMESVIFWLWGGRNSGALSGRQETIVRPMIHGTPMVVTIVLRLLSSQIIYFLFI